MSTINMLFHLRAFEDDNVSNNPRFNHWKWTRQIDGVEANELMTNKTSIDPNSTLDLFSGARNVTPAGTFDLTLKTNTKNTYILKETSDPSLNLFRTLKDDIDGVATVSVTKNGPLMTYTDDGGTAPFTNSAVGDHVRIGGNFNTNNLGTFAIIAVAADGNSFTINYNCGFAEDNIAIDDKSDIEIYSSDGIQKGDSITLGNPFMSSIHGTYTVTDVSHNYIEFISGTALPEETGVAAGTDIFSLSSGSAKFIYLEAESECQMTINGSALEPTIVPIFAGSTKYPGIFMLSADMTSISITNLSSGKCVIKYLMAE